MGASGWDYTVTYQEDVGAALRQLQQEVYDRGDYYRLARDNDLELTEEEFRARLNARDDHNGLNEYLLEDWRQRRARPTPVDPDTLLRAQPDSGTHTIIDVWKGIADHPEIGTASPLTTDELVAVFGTTTPRTEQVQQWMKNPRGMKHRENWVATYVISYRDGVPDHIHFLGFSGD